MADNGKKPARSTPNDLYGIRSLVDPYTYDMLTTGMDGQMPNLARNAMPSPEANYPPQAAGIYGYQQFTVPGLRDSNADGFVLSPNDKAPATKLSPATFIAPNASGYTAAHEAEHLLARNGLGSGTRLNGKFDELMGSRDPRFDFVHNAVAAGPYLKEKYGIDDAYFDPKMLKFQGALGPNLFYEQAASLAGVEARHGVDLTKDPVLRKTLFKDKNVRETYNAITGLRQTRLDARDLPPYTRQPEDAPRSSDKPKSKSMVERAKEMLGFAAGGRVRDI